jgi:hypothetical protein
MDLIDNWRKVLRYAISVRYIILALIFSGLEVALPYLEGYLPIPTGLFAALSGFASALAFYYRFKSQKVFKNEE